MMDSIRIFLDSVAATIDQRGKEYGVPEENLKRISTLWSIHLNFEITEYDVCLMMTLLKLARNVNEHKDDNLLDAAAYLAMANKLKDLS